MKGLLKRDCYIFLRPGILVLTVLLLFFSIVYPIIQYINFCVNSDYDSGLYSELSGIIVTRIIVTILILWSSISIIKSDSSAQWDMFLATTSLKRESYVTEKYVYVFWLITVLSFVSSISAAFYLHISKDYDLNIETYFLWIACRQASAAITLAFLLPVLLSSGAKKSAKITFFVIFGIVAITVLGILFYSSFDFLNFMFVITKFYDENPIAMIDLFGEPLVSAIVIYLLSWGLFILSWVISKKVYQEKQFGYSISLKDIVFESFDYSDTGA